MEEKHALMPLVLTNILIRDTNLPRKCIESTEEGGLYAMVYDGEGYINFHDGSRYEGQVVNGYFEGPGKFIYPDDTEL